MAGDCTSYDIYGVRFEQVFGLETLELLKTPIVKISNFLEEKQQI